MHRDDLIDVSTNDFQKIMRFQNSCMRHVLALEAIEIESDVYKKNAEKLRELMRNESLIYNSNLRELWSELIMKNEELGNAFLLNMNSLGAMSETIIASLKICIRSEPDLDRKEELKEELKYWEEEYKKTVPMVIKK